MKVKKRVKISVWQLLALAYLAGTVLGSILLILPCATKDGQSTSYLDALFTAASAVCITGLVPFDTATHWTLFGQLVILTLIQASGLGFIPYIQARNGARQPQRVFNGFKGQYERIVHPS